jgi:hypothetical protein
MKTMTPEEAGEFLAKLGLLDTHRKVEGKEREHLVMLFQMMKPFESSNNQHSWTDTYHIGDRVYNVHYWPGAEEAEIEEHIKYENKT